MKKQGQPTFTAGWACVNASVAYFLQEKPFSYALEALTDFLIQPVWLPMTISLKYFCTVFCLLVFPLVEDYVENSMFYVPLLKQTTCR